jgi:hypothetical protein
MGIKSVVLGLVATSVGVAQGSEIQAVVDRVYLGNDYGQHYFRSTVLELSAR